MIASKILTIIGGGMAGCEAAWQAANMGVKVHLYEMRPKVKTFAHNTDYLGEMVCSNSFRSDDNEYNAVGLLHWEMYEGNGLIIKSAIDNRLPAGGALAVDRDNFAKCITNKINQHPNIKVINNENVELEHYDQVIVATGPLTSKRLADRIRKLTGNDALSFYDAIAPIVYKESIDMSKAWMQSRYDKGGTEQERKAYLNCPMTKIQYENFIDALLEAEKTEFRKEEHIEYFNGCLPIEVMAERGRETLRYGPMKPVGLTNPNSKEKPYAVVQLRQDNAIGTLYNIVGFQTKMKYGAQKRVFSMIPGLENANFARLGGIHRNTFLNSPQLLDKEMRLKSSPNIRFAGQITGVEGYVESAAMGLIAGRFAAAEILGLQKDQVPSNTATGALLNHISGGADHNSFQPMNVNFGLFDPIDSLKSGRKARKTRYKAYTDRAKSLWKEWEASWH